MAPKRVLLLLVLSLTVFGGSSTFAAATNLVENGGFESSPAGAGSLGKLPPGWRAGIGSTAVLEIVAEARPGSAGKQCLKINGDDKRVMGGAFSNMVALEPGKALKVSAWIKPGHKTKKLRGIYFGLNWHDQNRKPVIVMKGTRMNYMYISRRETRGEWYRFHGVIPRAQKVKKTYGQTIPPNAAYFQIMVFTLQYPGPFWVDDIQAEAIDNETAKALVRAATPKKPKRRRGRYMNLPLTPVKIDSDWVVAWYADTKSTDHRGKMQRRYAAMAAAEMQTYLAKVLQTKVVATPWQPNTAKHVFVITDVTHAPKEIAARLQGKRRDAFVIEYPVKWRGRDVCMMVSQDEQAYDYPAYYFLTKFMDVHWVGPGELGEVYTPKPDWKMPAKIDVIENPDYEMRLWNSPVFRCRQWLGFGGRMGFHHALGHVFDPRKHGDTPEVYPLIKGKRYIPKVKPGGHALSGGWQPCTGSPKSVEIATRHVVDAFKKSGRHATVSLSVNDGAGNICECDLCRAQDSKDAFKEGQRPDLSDRFFRFYNKVIQEAVKEVPHARIAVLGYGAVRKPPHEVKVDPRIYVFHVQANVEALKAWKDAGANPNLYMWLWDGGFLTVRPDIQTVSELVKAGYEMGGIGFYSECIAHWVVCGPKFYVLARLLWDTDRDPDQLFEEYVRLAYGDGALHVGAFFRKWYEIYRRRPADKLHETVWGWRGPEQFEYLTRQDFAFMDQALARAKVSKLTAKQKKRLELLDLYYQAMRANGIEYIAGKELADKRWVASQNIETVIATAERTASLTGQFNRIYRGQVMKDKTGWILDVKPQKDPEAFWNSLVGQMRTMVSSSAETATDNALASLTQRMLKKQPKQEVIAFWEGQMKKRPNLESYIGPQVNTLKGVQNPNIVTNGKFEQGEPGNPPTLPGWDFYQFYGMVKGVKSNYEWRPGSGHDGGKAIGILDGRYPELKAIIHMEKDKRYTLSFWYKSEARESDSSFSIYYHKGPLPSVRGMDNHRLSRFVMIRLKPTDGKWQHVARTVRAPYDGDYVLMLATYYQKKGWRAWFDDIEIRKVW